MVAGPIVCVHPHSDAAMATRNKPNSAVDRAERAYEAWANIYRSTAQSDGYRKLANRLAALGYDAGLAPEVVENTIRRVAFVCAFHALDGRSVQGDFLRLQ